MTLKAKHLGLGILIGIGIALLTGASGAGGSNIGRYQIAAGTRGVYIINTANGQVWEKSVGTADARFLAPKE